MRRYTDARYVPYIRTRYRTRPVRNVRANLYVRSFLLLLRSIICVVCFVCAFSSGVKNFHSASESICEYKVSQLVNEYIDLGVLKTTGFSSDSFVIVSRNPEGQVTSVETNTMEVNRFAAVLSENILKEIKERQEDKIKAPVGAFTGNGLLSSLGFFISYRVIPEGKVTVSPSSFFDNAGVNQTVHRLQMDA